MAHPSHRYILQWSKMIAPQVKHFSFVREDNAPISFVAGQFMTLNIEGPNKIIHRSYSIANMPGVDNSVEMACAYVEGGVASNLLFNMKPGDGLAATGPFGLFVLKEEQPARYVLIATGTGVTPYRSMLNELRKRFQNSQPDLKVELIFGVRTPSELLFRDEFLKMSEEFPGFNFHACYSRETDGSLQSFEKKGHVQCTFDDLNLDPAKDIVYLCGNPNMIDDNFALLTEKGFDKKSVRREKYVFSH